MTTETPCFDILGVNLLLQCSSKPLEKKMREVFSAFPESQSPERLTLCPLTETPTDDFRERLHVFRQNGKKLLTYEKITLFRHEHLSLYEDGHSAVFYDRNKDALEGFVSEKSFERSSFFSHTYWTFILWEVLANRGMFLLHASALTNRQGHNYLFAANSRQGKSTITIALARAGYSFLSDDLVCLMQDGSIRALSRDLHVDPILAKRFPELSFLSERPNYFALNPKRKVAREEIVNLYRDKGCGILEKAQQIDTLFFPSIQPIEKSRLLPLGKGEALTRLIPPSVLIFVEEDASENHLRSLKHLVESAACFELTLGKDLYERPEEIANLLEERV